MNFCLLPGFSLPVLPSTIQRKHDPRKGPGLVKFLPASCFGERTLVVVR